MGQDKRGCVSVYTLSSGESLTEIHFSSLVHFSQFVQMVDSNELALILPYFCSDIKYLVKYSVYVYVFFDSGI